VIFTQENNFGFDTSVCDWRYKDTSWPFFKTPSFIEGGPESAFDEILKRSIPPPPQKILNGPYHKSEDYDKGEWKHEYMQWINRKYDLKLFRVLESWTNSFTFTAINLGGGYWLQADGFDPKTETRRYDRAFYLAFFWCDKHSSYNDGGIRLRRFLDHFAQMPNNPFEHCFLRATGHEILERHSKHLDVLEYNKRPTHTTKRLDTFYRYWLKAKPTAYKDHLGHSYYKAECFTPNSTISYKDSWPWPKLLEIEN
jgi:hypothetical protein